MFVTDRIIPWVAAGWMGSAFSFSFPSYISDTLFDIQIAASSFLFITSLSPYCHCAGLDLGADGDGLWEAGPSARV